MKKATKQTKTTENRPVTSGNLPRGRANNPKRCVSLNYRSPALPMAILCVDKFP